MTPTIPNPDCEHPAGALTEDGALVTGIEVAVLDMAGTTVADDGLVRSAFTAALGAAGITAEDPRQAGMQRRITETMGQSKIEVFRSLFGDEDLAARANAAFERCYADLAASGQCHEIPGAADAIRAMRAAGIRVALVTGFAEQTQHAILSALGWHALADLVLTPGPLVRGRPWPDLVLAAAMRLHVSDVRRIAVAGDTRSDMITGRNAGASVRAGVLTGTATRDELTAAGATHVIDAIGDLPPLLGAGNR